MRNHDKARYAIEILVVIARVVTFLLFIPHTIGLLMFFDLPDISIGAIGWVFLILFMGIIPILPRSLYRLRIVRILVASLCSIFIFSTMYRMYLDLELVGGADYPAFILRGVQTVALGILLLEVVLSPKLMLQNPSTATT